MRDDNFRRAVAMTLGSRCALDMLEACDVMAKDSSGEYLVHMTNPLPGDWEALEGRLLDPTDDERAAFVDAYRDAIESALNERDQ